MDLGIKGRWAILAGSSRGLGRACAESIAREGVNVVINGRNQEDVDVAVGELTSRYGVMAIGLMAMMCGYDIGVGMIILGVGYMFGIRGVWRQCKVICRANHSNSN